MSNNGLSRTVTPHINSFTGIKAISLLVIYCWHAPLPRPSVDIGTRLCEILFLISGFLASYNGYLKNTPCTWDESVRYVEKKLSVSWPLHAITMLAVMFFAGTNVDLSEKNITNAIINLSLLQAWSPKTHFSFNGATWFLSALMFCYFLTPFLLKLAKRIRPACIFFLFIFFIRAWIEHIQLCFPYEFWAFDVHTFPPARAMEYAMGMMLVPLFIHIRDTLYEKINQKCVFWFLTALECIVVAFFLWISIRFYKIWPRSSYLLPSCVLVFVFAFDRGVLSRFLSCRPLKWFSSFQLEFFILHQAVILCLRRYYAVLFPNLVVVNIVFFVTVIVFAVGYKKYFEGKLSVIFLKTTHHLHRILQV